MEDYTFKAVFHEIGFVAGVDISEDELEKLREEFVTMHNQFAYMSDGILSRVNETWENYEFAKLYSKELSDQMAETMGISCNATYQDWLTKWYEQLCDAIDEAHPFGKLKSCIFHDNGNPYYGVCFRKNPNWKMMFTIKEMDT